MLAGLSPNQLSMANTVLASALAGAMGIVAAPLAQADSTTLVLFIVPALAAALFAGFKSLVDRLPGRLRRSGSASRSMAWVVHAVVVPDRPRQPDPGHAGAAHVPPARVRAVAARRQPAVARRAGREAAAVRAHGRDGWRAPAVGLAVAGAVLLIVLPFGYRQALMLSLIGIVVCLSLVVITGFVGQVSLAQVTLAGVCRVRRVAHDRPRRHRLSVGAAVGSVAGVVVGLIVGASALARAAAPASPW